MVSIRTSVRKTLYLSQVSTSEKLFIEQLRDLSSAKNQLLDALPKMAEAADAAPIKADFKTLQAPAGKNRIV